MDRRIAAESLPIHTLQAHRQEPRPVVQPRAWRFAGFEFDLLRGELVGPDGAPISLRPKAETLLRHLLAGAGRLFSRDELMEAVWPSAVVTDDSLVQCVVELRTALGDREQRLIRTVPKRGYRLEVDVKPVFDEDPASNKARTIEAPALPQSGPPPSAAPGSGRRLPALRSLVLALSLSALLATTAARYFYPAGDPVYIDEEIAARGTIAVLRFVTPAEHPEVGNVADTVADEIAAQITTRVGMRGIGRAATAAFDGATPPLQRLRSELKANHVVTGRIATLGDDRLSIDVQLASAVDGEVFWARRFEGTQARGAAIGSDIGQQVVNAVRQRAVRIDPGTGQNFEKTSPVELTLQGWRDLDRRKSLEDVRRARSRFEAALRHDRSSVIATNGMAAAYVAERNDRGSRMTSAQIAEGERLVEDARALAPDDATALLNWGAIQINRGRPDLALPGLEKANRLVPSYPMGYILVSRSLIMLGRTDEVAVKLERAIELGAGDGRKTSSAYSLAAEAALMLGEDERARELARRAVAALPSNADAHAVLAAAEALTARHEQAANELAAFVKLAPAATVAGFDHGRPSTNPIYLSQRERLYNGLRKAGLRER